MSGESSPWLCDKGGVLLGKEQITSAGGVRLSPLSCSGDLGSLAPSIQQKQVLPDVDVRESLDQPFWAEFNSQTSSCFSMQLLLSFLSHCRGLLLIFL